MKTRKPEKKAVDQYLRYSNIALQMAVIIGGGVYGGLKLDQWLELEIPVFTVLLSLIAVVMAIYISIRDFLKKP